MCALVIGVAVDGLAASTATGASPVRARPGRARAGEPRNPRHPASRARGRRSSVGRSGERSGLACPDDPRAPPAHPAAGRELRARGAPVHLGPAVADLRAPGSRGGAARVRPACDGRHRRSVRHDRHRRPAPVPQGDRTARAHCARGHHQRRPSCGSDDDSADARVHRRRDPPAGRRRRPGLRLCGQRAPGRQTTTGCWACESGPSRPAASSTS